MNEVKFQKITVISNKIQICLKELKHLQTETNWQFRKNEFESYVFYKNTIIENAKRLIKEFEDD